MATALSIFFATIAVVSVLCLIVWLSIVTLRFVDRLTIGKPPTAEELIANQQKFDARLTRPRWDQLGTHFGCEIPSALTQLYADIDRLRHQSFYVIPPDATEEAEHYFVARFEPADLTTISQACLPQDGKYLPFASDDLGNYYLVDLSSRDLAVRYFDHDGGDISPVANKLETFLSWTTYRDEQPRT